MILYLYPQFNANVQPEQEQHIIEVKEAPLLNGTAAVASTSSYAEAVEKAAPAVVNIRVVQERRGPFGRAFESGGAGTILYNANDAQTENTDNHWTPTVHINNTDGLVIKGYIDDVIVPAETRTHIVNALEMLADKRQTNPDVKHSNIPL